MRRRDCQLRLPPRWHPPEVIGAPWPALTRSRLGGASLTSEGQASSDGNPFGQIDAVSRAHGHACSPERACPAFRSRVRRRRPRHHSQRLTTRYMHPTARTAAMAPPPRRCNSGPPTRAPAMITTPKTAMHWKIRRTRRRFGKSFIASNSQARIRSRSPPILGFSFHAVYLSTARVERPTQSEPVL
jgi:hypothetical protein